MGIAEDERDEAFDRLHRAHSNWMTAANYMQARHLPVDWKGTGEDLRHFLIDKGLRHPKTPHVWGAFIAELVRGKVIFPIGRTKMKDPSSHARKTDVYRKVKDTSFAGV